jgi:hypothetical protein
MATANEMMFRDLLSRDPDAWEERPSARDYQEFKEYAVKHYGLKGYELYMKA